MNTIIQALGGDKIMWYSQPKWWPLILTFMQVWKSMGYNMVVYLASITGIDSTLYEAATLDGATKWQQTKYITLPALKPIIVMMFILNVGHIFYSACSIRLRRVFPTHCTTLPAHLTPMSTRLCRAM